MLYAKTLDYMNIFFTGVFTVESCLKLVAFKIKVRCCHLFVFCMLSPTMEGIMRCLLSVSLCVCIYL